MFRSVVQCISEEHNPRLLFLAILVCIVGVYGSTALAAHAGRGSGRARSAWGVVSIVAAGCTAWATHMLGLLALNAGMPSAFDPALAVSSLCAAIAGVGIGVGLAVGATHKLRRFLAGLILGIGIVALHYIGQASFVVTGRVEYDVPLIAWSVVASLGLFGLAMVAAGARHRSLRRSGAPLLLAAIAVVHFGGVAAVHFVFDPTRAIPLGALSPTVFAPIVAGVSLALLAAAVLGLRFTLAAAAAARRDRLRLRELAGFALEGLAICDGEILTTANDSLEQLAGAEPGELVGRPISTLIHGIDIGTVPEREERPAELETVDGQRVPVRVLRRAVRFGSKPQIVVAVRDQRERLRAEAAMYHLAHHDPLTGLANRLNFNGALASKLASPRKDAPTLAVMTLDLDRFKLINDTLGHGMGDELLRRAARRFQRIVPDGDLVARLGGDEFAILLNDAGSLAALGAVADRLIDVTSRPFVVEGHVLNVGTSIGISVAPSDGTTPDELLRSADLALYRAKVDGRGQYRFYETEMNARMQARRSLELDLRRALARKEFELHFQPQVNAQTGHFDGAEALIRWRHPERGIVSPAEFIPLAEDTGLIINLGEWVVRAACAEAARWPSYLNVAVNVSPVQFRDDRLVTAVRKALADTGLPGHRLEIEITEGALLQEEERTFAALSELRALSVRISMDDFGTGYSSLSYLRRFPFDKIKIDQSFVRQIPHDAESRAIVRAIATLGASLGMKITAEGVENEAQAAFTSDEGCDQLQGFLYSRPVPATELRTLFMQPLAATA